MQSLVCNQSLLFIIMPIEGSIFGYFDNTHIPSHRCHERVFRWFFIYMKSNLSIAVQKKWRLAEQTKSFLETCGVVYIPQDKKLIVSLEMQPIDILLLSNADLVSMVDMGVSDCAIVWSDKVYEYGENVRVVQELWFASCRLSLAVPIQSCIQTPQDCACKTIATSYPRIVKRFFDALGIPIQVVYLSGSVEIATHIWYADAIVDIVSTGETLYQNNLIEICTLHEPQAVLIAHTNLSATKLTMIQELLSPI